jgi:hypothetical protein
LFHIVILAVCVSITSANATLIIGAFNNETLFVASDSCMTFQAGERLQQFKVPKLFKVSDRCCVSICNRYGGYIRIPQTTNVVQFLLPKELSKICSQYSASETNLEVGIDQVNSHFAIVYHYYVANRLDADPNPETRLTYWGYDQTHQRFFAESYLFEPSSGTNVPPKIVAFARGSERIGAPLTLSAEVGFLSALIVPVATHREQPDDKMIPLRTQAFRDEVEQIVVQETPMPPQRVIQFMLELFELHKNHAPHFDYDKGWIDEPYVFFVITPTSTESVAFARSH